MPEDLHTGPAIGIDALGQMHVTLPDDPPEIVTTHIDLATGEVTIGQGYICAECGEFIEGEEPHTAPDGEDVHPGCCVVCAGEGGCT